MAYLISDLSDEPTVITVSAKVGRDCQ